MLTPDELARSDLFHAFAGRFSDVAQAAADIHLNAGSTRSMRRTGGSVRRDRGTIEVAGSSMASSARNARAGNLLARFCFRRAVSGGLSGYRFTRVLKAMRGFTSSPLRRLFCEDRTLAHDRGPAARGGPHNAQVTLLETVGTAPASILSLS
jgi:hypothetical protein